MKHPVDDLLQRLYHNSDEDLLREFEAAEAEMEAEGGPQPDPEGFERLWNRIKEEGKYNGIYLPHTYKSRN